MLHIVLNSLGRGGAERSILALFGELLRRGLAVRLVLLQNLPDEYPVPASLSTHVVRLGAVSFGQAFWRLLCLLRQAPPGAVFALMPQANAAAVAAARLCGRRIVTSERTTPSQFYRPAAKLVAALLPHVLSARSVFISHYALARGLPDNPLGHAVRRHAQVLHNPVDCPTPLPAALAARRARLARLRAALAPSPGTPRGPLRLLVASRLVPGKGLLECLDSCQDLLRSGLARLAVAGDGPLRAALAERVAALGLSAQVSLLGFASNIFVQYAAHDVVLLCSESEGFGRVGFEAYQAGCLVVGLPDNSFVAEVLPDAPAWTVIKRLQDLHAGLAGLAAAAMPEDGADIARMREALGIQRHADRFIALLAGSNGMAA